MAIGMSPVRNQQLPTLPGMLRCGLLCLAAAWCAALPLAAGAAGDAPLRDPTRPPDAMLALSAGGAPLLPAEPQLQSVMIGADGRRAVIGGQSFRLGDRVGDARLVRITENEAVLAGASGRRTLKLFAPVKTPVVQRDAKSAGRNSSRNP